MGTETVLISLGIAIWVVAAAVCLVNAYVPEPGTRMTRRTQARLILTGWFFPIAAPIWLAIFIYLAVVSVLTGLYNTVRTAFSRSGGGRI